MKGVSLRDVKDCKLAVEEAYSSQPKESFNGYQRIEKYSDYTVNTDNSFRAVVYRNETTNQIIIAGKGTTILNLKDDYNDARLAMGLNNSQSDSLGQLYNYIQNKYPNSKIISTGHSLAGRNAQSIADNYSDIEVVAFSPFNWGWDKTSDRPNGSNIQNFGEKNDWFYSCGLNSSPGKNNYIPGPQINDDSPFNTPYNLGKMLKDHFWDAHMPENYGDINKATPVVIKSNSFNTLKELLKKGEGFAELLPKPAFNLHVEHNEYLGGQGAGDILLSTKKDLYDPVTEMLKRIA